MADLSSGADTLKSGTKALSEGANDAATGAAALAGGAAQLADGTSQLAGGADALATGAATLKDGTAQLRSGSVSLTDGVTQLLSGAKELRDGMALFDAQGIQKLTNLMEGDAHELIERLRALQELSGEYTSFAGTDADMPGSVQFIIRTESIEK